MSTAAVNTLLQRPKSRRPCRPSRRLLGRLDETGMKLYADLEIAEVPDEA
jgi:hypothetical protein